MERFTISLPPDLKAFLVLESAISGVPMAEIMRRGLEYWLQFLTDQRKANADVGEPKMAEEADAILHVRDDPEFLEFAKSKETDVDALKEGEG